MKKWWLIVLLSVVLLLVVGVAYAANSDVDVYQGMINLCSKAMSSPEVHARMHSVGTAEYEQMVQVCGDHAGLEDTTGQQLSQY